MMKLFDGRKVAEEILEEVKIANSKRERTPKLVSIVVGDQKGAIFYQELKKKRAKQIGIEIVIDKYSQDVAFTKLQDVIENLNNDDAVDGIMIQLPLPENFNTSQRDRLIDTIISEKDVDGMKKQSDFIAPVVKAVDTAVSMSEEWIHHNNYPYKLVIVGSEGFEGSKILQYYLHKNKQNSILPMGVDKNSDFFKEKILKADILISVTGIPNIIRSKMLKEGVVLIDVGSPQGDIDKRAYEKASFVSPVPGGIGPLTIAYLMENIFEASLQKSDY